MLDHPNILISNILTCLYWDPTNTIMICELRPGNFIASDVTEPGVVVGNNLKGHTGSGLSVTTLPMDTTSSLYILKGLDAGTSAVVSLIGRQCTISGSGSVQLARNSKSPSALAPTGELGSQRGRSSRSRPHELSTTSNHHFAPVFWW